MGKKVREDLKQQSSSTQVQTFVPEQKSVEDFLPGYTEFAAQYKRQFGTDVTPQDYMRYRETLVNQPQLSQGYTYSPEYQEQRDQQKQYQQKHEQDAQQYNRGLRMFGYSDMSDQEAAKHPEIVSAKMNDLKNDAATTIAVTTGAGIGYSMLPRGAQILIDGTIGGLSGYDMYKNGPTVGNVTGLALSGLSLYPEFSTAIGKGYNYIKDWVTPDIRSVVGAKLQAGIPLSEYEWSVAEGLAGGGNPSRIPNSGYNPKIKDFTNPSAYQYERPTSPEELEMIKLWAEKNNIDLSNFDLTKSYINPSRELSTNFSRNLVDPVTRKQYIGLTGQSDFGSLLYKLTRGLSKLDNKSEAGQAFLRLGVKGKNNTLHNIEDGRALIADVRGQAFKANHIIKDHYTSGQINPEDFTSGDLVEYLNSAHGGAYAKNENMAIKGFVKVPDSNTGVTYLEWDPKLSDAEVDAITDNWRKAFFYFKYGGPIYTRKFGSKSKRMDR